MLKTGLPQKIRELYVLVTELEAMYPGRHFTPDGHMIGSIGEVIAAEEYNLELFEASHPIHDAKTRDGKRLVQIKATQGNRIGLNESPDYLIVLRIARDGSYEEIYNGPGAPIWKASGKMTKTGQRHITLTKLQKLQRMVTDEDRISFA